MQVIPAIILARQDRRIRGIGQDGSEVDRGIEPALPTAQDPLVDRLPRLLPGRIAVGLALAAERRDGGPEDLEARRLRIAGDRGERRDEAAPHLLLRPRVRRRRPDVVHALEEQRVLGARHAQEVALVALHQRRAQTSREHGVAARRLVDHRDVGDSALLHLGEHEIGPAGGKKNLVSKG